MTRCVPTDPENAMISRFLSTASVSFLLACAVALAGCDGGGASDDGGSQTVGEVITTNSAFTQAADGFDRAGTRAELSDPGAGPFTVFVPSDDAFAEINAPVLFEAGNEAVLAEVMEYHVVEDRFPVEGTPQTVFIESREGTEVRLTRTETGVFVNGVEVEQVADTRNGLVYRLDTVQLRVLTLAQRLDVMPELSRLNEIVDGTGLSTTLDQPGPFTLLAPTDAALRAFTDDVTANEPVFEELLLYHLLPEDLMSVEVTDSRTVTTEEPDAGTVTFMRSGSTLFVNGILLASTDDIAENGVLHRVETPLNSGLSIAEVLSLRTDLATTSSLVSGSSSVLPPLSDEGRSLTFFAPDASAYDDVDVPVLEADASLTDELFSYHLLDDGAFSANALRTGSPSRTTAEGTTVRVDASGSVLQINRATVTGPDVRAANGVVHLLDGVLLETTRGTERIQLTSRYRLFETALDRVGLATTLASGTYTIFAPPNEAFLNALDTDGSGDIEDSEYPSDAALEDILLYHVVPGTIPSGNISDGDTATTLEGSSLVFDVAADGTITINPGDEAAVVSPRDLDAENGVVHEVDVLLTP